MNPTENEQSELTDRSLSQEDGTETSCSDLRLRAAAAAVALALAINQKNNDHQPEPVAGRSSSWQSVLLAHQFGQHSNIFSRKQRGPKR